VSVKRSASELAVGESEYRWELGLQWELAAVEWEYCWESGLELVVAESALWWVSARRSVLEWVLESGSAVG
jgi:hypothetical protein